MPFERPESSPSEARAAGQVRAYAPSGWEQDVEQAVLRARNFLFREMKEDGHWCAELESNASITAEYVFLHQILGTNLEGRRARIIRYFQGSQNRDGSWGIAAHHPGDVSTSAEVYLALRILGVAENEPWLLRTQRFIRTHGGLEAMRVFTRIHFALFGLIPWDAVPAIPPEFILVPSSSPINLYRLSSWARGTMVPLFIICHFKPVFSLPNGRHENNPWLDHLWLDPEDKRIPYAPSWLSILRRYGVGWKAFFKASDLCLKLYEANRPARLRQHAIEKCAQWILEHQEPTGDWAGIFPPMVNGVLALRLLGYSLSDWPLKAGLEAIERFCISDKGGYRTQACVSPVWDTVLSSIALLDSGHPASDPRLIKAMEWLKHYQLRVEYGDWKVYNPKGRGAGWSFEYYNSWYPDVDDTLAVVLGLLKHSPRGDHRSAVDAALDWVASMQNDDGGFAAFDLNNDRHYLNEIPFSDMDALCDSSCPDITGRALEAFGLFAEMFPSDAGKYREVVTRAVGYLERSQEGAGSWFGRWGVNYVYGTSHALCGLARVGIAATHPMVQRGITWLMKVQNTDGGWGECLETYRDKRLMGIGDSTASQTAWALMGLLAYLGPSEAAIERGVRYLVSTQRLDGPKRAVDITPESAATWEETHFTGTGFPNHFYLRYHLYRHYFPLMALGRYLEKSRA